MSGAHEGCSQGKSVRDREGSKHSTAATLERVEGEAAVLPQAFKDRVLARQLAGVVQESGAKDESSRFGTLTFNMTHASERATRRGREKKSKSDPHCWSRKVCRISFHTHVQHVCGGGARCPRGAGAGAPVAVPGSVRVDRGRGPVSRLPSLKIVHLGLG